MRFKAENVLSYIIESILIDDLKTTKISEQIFENCQ